MTDLLDVFWPRTGGRALMTRQQAEKEDGLIPWGEYDYAKSNAEAKKARKPRETKQKRTNPNPQPQKKESG